MERKLILSAFLAATAWSLSSLVTADWETGPCPGGSTEPCIESEISGSTYHFNGTGDHTGEWHGLPTTGEDFEFSGYTDWTCDSLSWDCTVTWNAKIKKCQDASGDWRIGLQINTASIEGGVYCNVTALGDFPWYAQAPIGANHCPFEDQCDNFIPYNPSASSYAANLGEIDMTVLGIPRITDGHLHGVVFTSGAGATFDLYSAFYDCDENDLGCSVYGTLTLTNATSLDIQ